jgi:transposase
LITAPANLKVLVASRPIDFRRGVNGLVALVADQLAADPYCGDVFIFRSKRHDRLKLIVWDGTGMIMLTKWLEEGRFAWPPVADGAVTLNASQMSMLIDGLDWSRVTPQEIKKPSVLR